MTAIGCACMYIIYNMSIMSVWHCYITGKSSSEGSGWGEDHVDVDVPKGAVTLQHVDYPHMSCS